MSNRLILTWQWVMITAMLVVMSTCSIANAHNDAIIKCDRNLVVKEAIKLGEETTENGLLIEYYDRNRDGKPDIRTMSSSHGIVVMNKETGEPEIVHNPKPIFWGVDLDFNGKEDMIYVDICRDGRCAETKLYCEDIKPYIDLNGPLPGEFFHGQSFEDWFENIGGTI